MNTFKKEERLCSKRLLNLLFKNGSSFLFYPFRVTFLVTDENCPFPAQIVISVAKKRYKRAVDRNLIKRLSKEVYRTQKEAALYPHLPFPNKTLLFSIQYVGKSIYAHAFFEKKMSVVLKRLVQQINGHEDCK